MQENNPNDAGAPDTALSPAMMDAAVKVVADEYGICSELSPKVLCATFSEQSLPSGRIRRQAMPGFIRSYLGVGNSTAPYGRVVRWL